MNAIDNQCNAELTKALATLTNKDNLMAKLCYMQNLGNDHYEFEIEVRVRPPYGTIPNFSLNVVFDRVAYIRDGFTVVDGNSDAIDIDRVQISRLHVNDKHNATQLECLSRLISNEGLNVIAGCCYNYTSRKKAIGEIE